MELYLKLLYQKFYLHDFLSLKSIFASSLSYELSNNVYLTPL